ncbi:MAG: putative ABC transport system substrate-binding protein [Parcubacteria group bacterium Greene1014_15]|nr:MAG: putative ABC transport system substrate-binding protein [Parcubacteria group bacterium Greene1014_15]
MKKSLFISVCIVFFVGVLVLYRYPKISVEQKIYRVGIPKPLPTLLPAFEGFKTGMKNQGYEEGKNISYAIIEEGANPAETKERLEKFILEKPDLIYVLGVNAARDAKELSAKDDPTLPIVFAVVSDPVGNGLVADLRSSGNNLTGVSGGNDIIAAKRVELFLELVPRTKRIIFIWNNALTTGIEHVRKAVAAAQGVELVEHHVQSEADVDAYLLTFSPQEGDALFRAPDSVLARRVKKLSEWTLAHNIPLVGTNSDDVRLGALMSYGADFEQIGEQAAEFADHILKGAKPADIPVAYPARYEFVLNTQTAEKLGMTFSPDALANVDKYVP